MHSTHTGRGLLDAHLAIVAEAETKGQSSQVRDVRASVDDGPIKYSDAALAELFIEKHKYQSDRFRYVEQWGWMMWTGSHWKRTGEGKVMGYVKPICLAQSKASLDDWDIDIKSRAGFARGLASSKTIAAATKNAAIDHRLYLEASQFDTNLWLFNTPGGTIDLKTGELREHSREDYITKIAGATPTDEVDCRKWLAFLEQITDGNRELQDYLQRLGGYAMVGDPCEECLDFFYGQGGNGKGTFLKTLQYIFGSYATTAATETFLESKWSRHPTDVAKLAGARLVVAQEIDKGRMWNEALIKTLTGRDVMTARFMRKDYFDFLPQFTLIISGNNRPSLKAADAAWRRRLHLVPFNRNIPPEQQDPKLKTELESEAGGILRWCVIGCLLWQQNRLSPPEIVLEATEDYLQEEDKVPAWTETVEKYITHERTYDNQGRLHSWMPREESRTELSIHDVCVLALELPEAQCTDYNEKRVAECLRYLGWKSPKGSVWRNGVKVRLWTAPKSETQT
jgi:putative DNA primase/helicase